MSAGFEILTSSRNKIVLDLRKEQFIHLKFEKRYLKSNAFNLALLASAAYLDVNRIKEFLFTKNKMGNREFNSTGAGNVKSGFLSESEEKTEDIDLTFDLKDETSTDSQFFHFHTEEYLLLAFRGTEPKKIDALTDANAGMVSFAEVCGMVHKGFYLAFKSIQNYIDQAVQDAPGKNVILTGHSLGGALATMAAAYIRKKHKREILLYTFGCPLVGDTTFTNHCTNVDPIAYYRVVHNQDLVTMVPPPHAHLRMKILHLALVNPLFLIPATYDPFGKPFNQFGKLVFIRRTDQNAFSVDVDRKTPAYIRIPKEVTVREMIAERPKWEQLLNWAGMSTADHSMANYVSILGSDLKSAIESYLYANQVTAANSEKIIAYLEGELKSIRTRHAELEKKLLLPSGGTIYADASATGTTPPDKLTPAEKMKLLEDAMSHKHMELSMQRSFVSSAKQPGYKDAILKGITDLKMTPILNREFEYQQKSILY